MNGNRVKYFMPENFLEINQNQICPQGKTTGHKTRIGFLTTIIDNRNKTRLGRV